MSKVSFLAAAITLAGSLTAASPNLYASTSEIEVLKQQLLELTNRLQQLEQAHQSDTTATSLGGQNNHSTAVTGQVENGPTTLTFSGLVEIETAYHDDVEGSSSDITVATAELAVDAQVTDTISAAVVALYEENEPGLDIDIATITLANLANTGLNLTLGQTYMPFGSFETYLVNDTLVLEMAEIRETAAILGWGSDELSAAVYIFNGDIDEDSDTLENYGASLSWNSDNLSLGADYISNILDSDGLSDAIAANGMDLGDVNIAAGAYALRASTDLGGLMLLTEYVATESFTLGSFVDRELEALHIEGATEIGSWTLALAWQETKNAEDILAEERLSLGASTNLSDNVGLGLEYWHDKEYNGDKSDNLLLKLSLEF